MLNAKLVVVGGDAKAKEVNLRLPCIIGRGREATLTLPHPLVSRQHTQISERDGRLYVKDMGSLNGTFLNNKRLEQEELLEPNQLLTLGNVTFRAVYEVANETEIESVETLNEVERSRLDRESELEPKSAMESAIEDKETVYDEKANATSDTDKSLVESTASSIDDSTLMSDVFVEVEDENTPDAVSSIDLDGAVPETPAAVSFAGGIELGSDARPESVSRIDSIELDFGETPSPSKPAEDSGLDSFIRKLPR